MNIQNVINTLRNNIRNPEGDVCREGIYDNRATREALRALLDAHQPEHERQPIPEPGSQREADALMAAGLAWYQERECLDELPAEVLDPIMVGNMVSIDVSTCDEDADYRVFGRIIEWQDQAPDGESDRVWLCDLDQFSYDPRDIPPQELAEAQPLTIQYTNWKGDTRERRILPKAVRFGATKWHPEPQFLLRAFDVEKNAEREFALKDIGGSATMPVWTDCADRLPTNDDADPWGHVAFDLDGEVTRTSVELIAECAHRSPDNDVWKGRWCHTGFQLPASTTVQSKDNPRSKP